MSGAFFGFGPMSVAPMSTLDSDSGPVVASGIISMYSLSPLIGGTARFAIRDATVSSWSHDSLELIRTRWLLRDPVLSRKEPED